MKFVWSKRAPHSLRKLLIYFSCLFYSFFSNLGITVNASPRGMAAAMSRQPFVSGISMPVIKPSKPARLARQVAPGALAIALVTLALFRKQADFAIPMLLYLLVVVVQSLRGGLASAVFVSVIAVASLDFFFIPPVLEWQIYDPKDGVALLTYLATSLVITRLASKARTETSIAEQRRRDATLLYDTASLLLSLDPEAAGGPESLRIFRRVFGLRAASSFDAAADKLQIEGDSAADLAERTRHACDLGKDLYDRERDLYIRCLFTGEKITGAIGFEGRIENESIVLALSALAATALERMHSFRNANRAAADAQAETMRCAIVDAFAHEFKTPLAVILAASGGLRETSGPANDQLEMIDLIENQTLHLNQLTTRLLRMARLDRVDVKPQMEPTSLQVLLGRMVDQCRNQLGRDISLHLPSEEGQVMADPELLSLAIAQLVENACKYSSQNSAVAVDMELEMGHAEVFVSNQGSSIRPDEEERIFERFFRGAATELAKPGAGLGLYVARKIVRAHGGILELDRNHSAAFATTFKIRLPILPHERKQELQTYQSANSGR
jgi:two-component system sensor histidine kinase KdpD